jgi:sugar lactone lactonase YvrE
MKIRSAWLGLCLVVLAAASCGSTDDSGGLVALDLELLAGDLGGPGSADGIGAAGRFHHPAGVAVDGAGNLYVADQFNHTLRKVTAAGVVTTLAGTPGMYGSADDTGAAARFNFPAGVAVDSTGNLYVADTSNETIRRVTAAGVVTTLAGSPGLSGSADGAGPAARFFSPAGMTVDSAGNLYVVELGNETLRKITADGVVTTLAGTPGMSGSADGTGPAARFSDPAGMTVDSAGNLYVADTTNDTLRKVTADGVVTTLAGTPDMSGSADDTGPAARFNRPAGVAVDGAGNVYVADAANDTLRKVTADGVVTTLAGAAGMSGSADGAGPAARFFDPSSVAVDGAGNVYVVDRGNHTLRKVTAAGVVTTLAGTPGMPGSADGAGPAARFNSPTGVAVDGAGNVYVADASNYIIRKVTADGVVTTLAGTAGRFGSVDGVGPAARFGYPMGVAADSAGNLYVTDHFSYVLRKVTADGVVTTLAGTGGMSGSADGKGPAVRFNEPTSVAVDRVGNVYVADNGNHTLRKVTPTGTTTTIAGVTGVAGIILGTTPRLGFPQSLAIVGDDIVFSDTNAILVLRHGAQ